MALTATHPAHAVVSPGIARTTEQLVAVNAVTGWILSFGLVVAPAAAGAVLAASGPAPRTQLERGVSSLPLCSWYRCGISYRRSPEGVRTAGEGR